MDISEIAGPSNKADPPSMLPESSTVSSPEHFSKKRKLPTSTPTTASRLPNKKTCLNIISDRFVNRKNTKDNLDAKIVEKKMLILDIEYDIKKKELDIKNMQIIEMQEKNEFLRKKQNLEIQLLEVDLKRKQIELKILERELDLK